MSRKRRAERRIVTPDPEYNSQIVARIITNLMRRGKKSVAEHIIYSAFDYIKEQLKGDPLEVVIKAIDNVKPKVEVKSRRVGGATYQVPVEVGSERQVSLALRWMIQYAQARKGTPMRRALALEILDAYKNQGNAIKKRDDVYKMAQANRAFAHYGW